MIVDERAVDAERELYVVEVQASGVEQEFQKQKESADTLSSNAIHLAIKLREASEWVASMHQQMIDARQAKVKAIVSAKAKVANLKKRFHAKIKDLKEDDND